MEAAENSKMERSVLDLHTRDVETYQDEPLTWNTVVADSSSHDSATTENDEHGEILGEMQGKRRDATWPVGVYILLLATEWLNCERELFY